MDKIVSAYMYLYVSGLMLFVISDKIWTPRIWCEIKGDKSLVIVISPPHPTAAFYNPKVQAIKHAQNSRGFKAVLLNTTHEGVHFHVKDIPLNQVERFRVIVRASDAYRDPLSHYFAADLSTQGCDSSAPSTTSSTAPSVSSSTANSASAFTPVVTSPLGAELLPIGTRPIGGSQSAGNWAETPTRFPPTARPGARPASVRTPTPGENREAVGSWLVDWPKVAPYVYGGGAVVLACVLVLLLVLCYVTRCRQSAKMKLAVPDGDNRPHAGLI